MKYIVLSRGLRARVSNKDYPRLAKLAWHAHPCGKHIYAGHTVTLSGVGSARRRKIVLMHRELLSAAPGTEVDHINGNGLDNQRSNLRLATSTQNKQNQRKTRGRSKFKGVVWHEKNGKWQAQLCWRENGKLHNSYLGSFTDERAAARAYDAAAKLRCGRFANINL